MNSVQVTMKIEVKVPESGKVREQTISVPLMIANGEVLLATNTAELMIAQLGFKCKKV
jgi:hypothetical protein